MPLPLPTFASAALLLLLFRAATTSVVAAAVDSQQRVKPPQWVRPLGLQPFTDHFEWNTFCAVRLVESAVPQTHVYKDLLTGELKQKDSDTDVDADADAEDPESAVLSDSIVVDSRFNSTSCAGNPSQLAWVQRVEDEQEWDRLVRTKVNALFASSDDDDEISDDNDDDDGEEEGTASGTMWLLEVEAKSAARGALRALPRDVHIHRRANSSTVFAMAYLSTQSARAFAAAWDPVAIFPAPDELKIAPSVYLLTHPEAVASLLSSSGGAGESTIRRTSLLDEDVEILVILHDPVDADSIANDHVAELLRKCQSWLMAQGISGKAVRAGARRLIVSMRRGVAEVALPDLLHRIILPQPEVLFVEARERFKLHNQYSAAITQNGTLTNGAKPMYDKGLSGAGQIVGVGDSGLDVRSCFFYEAANAFPQDGVNNLYPDAEKVVQYVAFADNVEGEASGHGTHVAGSVAAFGGSSTAVNQGSQDEMEDYRGVAYNAKIAFFDMGYAGSSGLAVPGDLYNDFLGIAYEAGARIHTNSWGTDVNAYTTTSRDMDRYSYDHQDFLVLVAGGNSGDAGFYTIGSPATAKNVLAVGASMSNALGFSDDTTGPYCGSVASCTNYFVDLADNLASFSSLGPTFDGRMKPDVVSVGFYISSAYSSANPNSLTCAVEAKAGTSMATPVTAGAAALIREYFENDGIVPMGALIKAALIHSASPLSDPDWERGMGNDNVQLDGEVDTNQGYGLIGLHRVLSFDDSPFQLKYYGACSGNCEEEDFADLPNVEEDGVFERVFRVASADQGGGRVALAATLVYHDPAASSYTQNLALINDLDLEIVAPDGTIILPLAPGGGTDVNTYDNAEKVIIPVDALELGMEYKVRVRGTSVPIGPQPFALVVTGNFAPEEVEDIVDDIVADLTQSGDLQGEVQEASPGIAAGIAVSGFVIVGLLIAVVVLFFKQGKWASIEVTPAVVYASAACRIGELVFAAVAMALVVRDTRIIIFANDPPLAFSACGGAGPYLVALTTLVIVTVTGQVALLLKFMLDAPLWVDRFIVAVDAIMIVLVLAGIVVGAVATCGIYSLYYLPAAMCIFVLLLLAVSFCLALARLVAVDDVFKPAAAKKGEQAQQQDPAAATGAAAAPAAAQDDAETGAAASAAKSPPMKKEEPAKSKAKAAPPPIPDAPATSKKPTVAALYDYEAANPDELTFGESDTIEVTSVVDEGWASGRNTRTGKTGLFPRNYCDPFSM